MQSSSPVQTIVSSSLGLKISNGIRRSRSWGLQKRGPHVRRNTLLDWAVLAAVATFISWSQATLANESGHALAERKSSDTLHQDDSAKAVQWLDNSQLHDIDEKDPAHALIQAYADSVKEARSEKGVCEIVIDYMEEVKGPASHKLFPDCRFFACKWKEQIDPSQPTNVRAGAASVVDALVLDKKRRLTLIGPGKRHDKSFGELLAEHKVRITDEKSARLVWDAFCEVRRWIHQGGDVEKVSDRLWRVGIHNRSAKRLGRGYYEVHLNEDLTVESAGRVVEDADGRRWDWTR